MGELAVPKVAVLRPGSQTTDSREDESSFDLHPELDVPHGIPRRLSALLLGHSLTPALGSSSLPFTNIPGTRPPPPRSNTPLKPRGRNSRRRRSGQLDPAPDSAPRYASGSSSKQEHGEQDSQSSFSNGKVDGAEESDIGPHGQRMSALETHLGSILRDGMNPIIFVCWGKSSDCTIVPVPLTNYEDEAAVWTEIRRAWLSRLGWKKYVPWYNVKRVDLVELSLAGVKPNVSGESAQFMGMYRSRNLKSQEAHFQKIVDDYQEMREYPCGYDVSTGKALCMCTLTNCASGIGDEECPTEIIVQAMRSLRATQTHDLMTTIFFHPELASVNGFLQAETVIYGHSILYSWHCPELRELEYQAVLLDDNWEDILRWLAGPLTILVPLMTVLIAQYIFGDWGTAWNVGCFFVAFTVASPFLNMGWHTTPRPEH
ncbi:hypothetical protein PDE_06153 [Penicillium oxalicum 114-2]|uniref:Uncharacterized protein n=1 Tax=Penicillium oxalicum (strain 114-2 / CGMCC 5302) TaxID=933388 RepID=S8AXW2_PENO1|nr:hypothetical protein PDE_06153 [Penicillium oxalicum 114-2]